MPSNCIVCDRRLGEQRTEVRWGPGRAEAHEACAAIYRDGQATGEADLPSLPANEVWDDPYFEERGRRRRFRDHLEQCAAGWLSRRDYSNEYRDSCLKLWDTDDIPVSLDLHGFTVEEGSAVLRAFIKIAKTFRLPVFGVIYGKGDRLAPAVLDLLQRDRALRVYDSQGSCSCAYRAGDTALWPSRHASLRAFRITGFEGDAVPAASNAVRKRRQPARHRPDDQTPESIRHEPDFAGPSPDINSVRGEAPWPTEAAEPPLRGAKRADPEPAAHSATPRAPSLKAPGLGAAIGFFVGGPLGALAGAALGFLASCVADEQDDEPARGDQS